MHETLIKRTIYVIECSCNPEDKFRKIFENDPPRDMQCPHCGSWVEPVEESYIGKERLDKK